MPSLSQMDANDGRNALSERTARFCAELRPDFAHVELPIDVVEHASIFWLHPHTGHPGRPVEDMPARHAARFRKKFRGALALGVYLPRSGFELCLLSMAHDPHLLGTACTALVEAALEAGVP